MTSSAQSKNIGETETKNTESNKQNNQPNFNSILSSLLKNNNKQYKQEENLKNTIFDVEAIQNIGAQTAGFNNSQQQIDKKEDQRNIFQQQIINNVSKENIFNTSNYQKQQETDLGNNNIFSCNFKKPDEIDINNNIFSSKYKNPQEFEYSNNIFSSNNKQPQMQGNSIFGNQSTCSKHENNEESDDEDGCNDSSHSSIDKESINEEAQQEKEQKYEYQSDFEFIFKYNFNQKQVDRFKFSNNIVNEMGYISIEKHKVQNNFDQKQSKQRNMMKVLLNQCFLIENISDYKILNKENKTLQIIGFSYKNQEQKTQNQEDKQVRKDCWRKEICKIKNENDFEEFKKIFEEILTKKSIKNEEKENEMQNSQAKNENARTTSQ